MPIWEEFPYTNFHELNLDWLLKEMKELRHDFAEFVGGHEIKYADPILWDILTSYLAYTIVLDSYGNAYMSIQDTPAGTALTNTDYWMQIGNFYSYVPQIVEDEGIYPQVRMQKHFRYYLNGSTGSDDNTGLSASQAFKTLDKALSMTTKTTQMRLTITAAGTYELHDIDNISGVAILIDATVSGVVIKLNGDSGGQFSFYNCHIHLAGVDANNPITLYCEPVGGVYHMIYGVNSTFSFDYVSMPYNRLQVGAGSATLTGCTMKTVRCSAGSFLEFNDSKIINQDPTLNAIIAYNSTVRVYGTFEVDTLPILGTNVAILDMVGSDLFYSASTLPAVNTQYQYGVYANYARVKMTTAKMNAFAAAADTGNEVSAASNEILTY